MTQSSSPFVPYEPAPDERLARVGTVLAEAGEGDAEALGALQAGVRGGDASQWAERIGRVAGGERSAVVLARVDGDIAGYANVTHLDAHPVDGAPGGFYLTGVTVTQRWRRRGVGGLLTRWRMDWVWQRDTDVRCFISVRNRASVDMHRALGFSPVRSGSSFQGVTFTGGEGVLLRARRPASG